MPSAAILEVSGLTKRFGGLTAVSSLDFEVREGEILGMIGPNGAGKSTTFNLIAGTYAATQGEVRFAGEPIQLNVVLLPAPFGPIMPRIRSEEHTPELQSRPRH